MRSDKKHEYLKKSTFWLAISCSIILTPFCINNFLRGRYFLGIGSFLILLIISINAWMIRQDRYNPRLILSSLIPAIIIFLILSIQKQGIIGVLWCYPAVISFYMMLPEKTAWISNIALITIIIPFAWYIIPSSVAIRMIATLVAVSIFSAIFTRVINEQKSRLVETAITDQLTGLLNRNLLQINLQESILHSKRSGEPMAMLILDIDHFKKINDQYGHDKGDIVLKSIAEILLSRLRGTDKVFRIGGEEFLSILYGTEVNNAMDIAEFLRTAISSQQFLPGENITASLGVASYSDGDDWLSWMKRCDEKLYKAKNEGRNRVVG